MLLPPSPQLCPTMSAPNTLPPASPVSTRRSSHLFLDPINTTDKDIASITFSPATASFSSSNLAGQPPSPSQSPAAAATPTHTKSRSASGLSPPINPFPIATQHRVIVAPFNYLRRASVIARAALCKPTHESFLLKAKSKISYFGTHDKRHMRMVNNHLMIGAAPDRYTTMIDLAGVTVHRGRVRDPNADDEPLPADTESTQLTLICKSVIKINGQSRNTQHGRTIKLCAETAAAAELWRNAITQSQSLYHTFPIAPPAILPTFVVFGANESGRSSVFKHACAWRPESLINPMEKDGYMDADSRRQYRIRILCHLLTGLSNITALTEKKLDEAGKHLHHDIVIAGEACADEVVRLKEIDSEEQGDDRAYLTPRALEYCERILASADVMTQLKEQQHAAGDFHHLQKLIHLIPKLATHTYIPSFHDIICCHYSSATISWKPVTLSSEAEKFRVYDVGGSTTADREKRWKLERFSAANTLIFTVDLIGYNRSSPTMIPAQPNATALYESLVLYEQLLASPHLRRPINVFFTFKDVLQKQLDQTPFNTIVPLYTGPNTTEAVSSYIQQLFAGIGGTRYRGFVVSVLDTHEMNKAINTVVKHAIQTSTPVSPQKK